MIPSRATVYAALVARLNARLTAPTSLLVFGRVENRVRDWSTVTVQEMPYLGVALRSETYLPLDRTQSARAGGLYAGPARWRLMPRGWVYVRTGDDRGNAQEALANALDAIEAALVPAPGLELETLGDTVYSARLHDIEETDEGSLGQTAVAKIVLEVLTEAGYV